MRVLPKTTHHLWLILLLITIAVFHTATIRPGHIWGDDFAMYIHHARNIVEGRPYAQTGYLYYSNRSNQPSHVSAGFSMAPHPGSPILWPQSDPDEIRAGNIFCARLDGYLSLLAT
jgi:hypothetical protein